MTKKAITFDANVFYNNRFHFDGGLLLSAKQLAKKDVTVVMPSIVVEEIKKGVREEYDKLAKKLQAILNDANRLGVSAADALAAIDADVVKEASDKVDGYLGELGAVILKSDEVTAQEVADLYAELKPPFSTKKRSEFPDAIALLTLEKWAAKAETEILAVSSDGDWSEFADTSDHITCTDDLAGALDQFQDIPPDQAEIIQNVLSQMAFAKQSALYESFQEQLDAVISDHVFSAEAGSSYYLELQEINVSLIEFDMGDEGEPVEYKTVEAGEDEFVLEVSASVTVKANASFTVNVWDGTDKEYVSLTDATASTELTSDAQLLVSISSASDAPTISRVELIGIDDTIVFDDVEPDWGGPDE